MIFLWSKIVKKKTDWRKYEKRNLLIFLLVRKTIGSEKEFLYSVIKRFVKERNKVCDVISGWPHTHPASMKNPSLLSLKSSDTILTWSNWPSSRTLCGSLKSLVRATILITPSVVLNFFRVVEKIWRVHMSFNSYWFTSQNNNVFIYSKNFVNVFLRELKKF